MAIRKHITQIKEDGLEIYTDCVNMSLEKYSEYLGNPDKFLKDLFTLLKKYNLKLEENFCLFGPESDVHYYSDSKFSLSPTFLRFSLKNTLYKVGNTLYTVVHHGDWREGRFSPYSNNSITLRRQQYKDAITVI